VEREKWEEEEAEEAEEAGANAAARGAEAEAAAARPTTGARQVAEEAAVMHAITLSRC